MQKVLVIIPTYNEALNIRQVIEALQAVAARSKSNIFRVLVVDDRSPDGTAKIVKKLQREYGNIHLLSGKKAGLGRAYMRGFKYALKQEDFDVAVMMDADLSHKPSDIPALLKDIQQGADYVIGSRYVAGGTIKGDWPLSRRINSQVANFVARKLVGISQPVTDLTGGFKAIRREALAQIDLDNLRAGGYFFQVSLLHAFLLKEFRVREVPITFMNRTQGNSKLKMSDIIEFLYSAYKLDPNAPVQKFVRFGFVGACGTVVNLGILSFLVHFTDTEVLIAALIAIELSIVFNFFLNHYYTFKGYGSYQISARRESIRSVSNKMLKFNIGALGGAIISFSTFSLLYKVGGVHYAPADIIAILVAMSWNFWISTHYVWRAIDPR